MAMYKLMLSYWTGKIKEMGSLGDSNAIKKPPVLELVAAICRWHIALKWVLVPPLDLH